MTTDREDKPTNWRRSRPGPHRNRATLPEHSRMASGGLPEHLPNSRTERTPNERSQAGPNEDDRAPNRRRSHRREASAPRTSARPGVGHQPDHLEQIGQNSHRPHPIPRETEERRRGERRRHTHPAHRPRWTGRKESTRSGQEPGTQHRTKEDHQEGRTNNQFARHPRSISNRITHDLPTNAQARERIGNR